MNKAETTIVISAEDNASSDLENIQGLMRALGEGSEDVTGALARLGGESANLCATMTEMGEHLPVERLRETVLLMERLGATGPTSEEGATGSVASSGTQVGSANVFYITVNALDSRDVEQFFRERLEPYLQQRSRDGYDVIWADGLRQVS